MAGGEPWSLTAKAVVEAGACRKEEPGKKKLGLNLTLGSLGLVPHRYSMVEEHNI